MSWDPDIAVALLIVAFVICAISIAATERRIRQREREVESDYRVWIDGLGRGRHAEQDREAS